jgi:YYY domain-containing protein
LERSRSAYDPIHWITPLSLILLLISAIFLAFWADIDQTLLTNWLEREGSAIVLWWLLSTLAGLAALPLLFRLLKPLPSRGYALARAGGLMLTAFVFWYLASLGLWQNTPGAMVMAWGLVGLAGLFAWQRLAPEPDFSWRAWWREHWILVVLVEVSFVALLLAAAAYRAHEPEIRTTEKPMEIMFINSIRQSETFPPNDAWLAGYSISYYYFGYVITAGLADLSGVNTGVAFGLMAALLFALTGIGALGLVYDLLRLRWTRHISTWGGFLAMILLIGAGNLGVFFIEQPWNGQGLLGGRVDAAYFDFWDVPERSRLILREGPEGWRVLATGEILTQAPAEGENITLVRDENNNQIPDFEEESQDRGFTDWNFWWWFRYSRVVGDDFLNGDRIGVQPIAEFPHFSFVLADIHPHVLALPFTLLALTLAAGHALRSGNPRPWEYALLGIWVGGMAFMNSWDAVYILFLVAAEALRRLLGRGHWSWSRHDSISTGLFGLVLLGLTFLFYFPWILSFSSQAGGFYFNIIWNTLPQQTFLQFGAFFLLLAPFLGLEIWRARRAFPGVLLAWPYSTWALWFGVVFVAIALVFPLGMAWVYHQTCEGANGGLQTSACLARQVLFGGANPSLESAFWADVLARRSESFLSHGLILALIVWVGLRLWYWQGQPSQSEPSESRLHPATAYALLLLAAGLVLILAPDFVYLVDNFRVRINTVFKFYYQGWIFLSLASAYAAAALWAELQQQRRWPALVGLNLLIVGVLYMGLQYPLYAARTRGLEESGRYAARTTQSEASLTLDGRARSLSPDEYAVITCLMESNPPDDSIVAEAPFNGGYNIEYGRVAALTGIPNLLGWINHQGQWRGSTYDTVTEVIRDPQSGAVTDSREMQADALYQTSDWAEFDRIVQRYSIDYVMLGNAERLRYADYQDGLAKFEERYRPMCQSGTVALYSVGG